MSKETETTNGTETDTTKEPTNNSHFKNFAKRFAMGFCIGFTVTTLAAAAYLTMKSGGAPVPTENS